MGKPKRPLHSKEVKETSQTRSDTDELRKILKRTVGWNEVGEVGNIKFDELHKLGFLRPGYRLAHCGTDPSVSAARGRFEKLKAMGYQPNKPIGGSMFQVLQAAAKYKKKRDEVFRNGLLWMEVCGQDFYNTVACQHVRFELADSKNRTMFKQPYHVFFELFKLLSANKGEDPDTAREKGSEEQLSDETEVSGVAVANKGEDPDTAREKGSEEQLSDGTEVSGVAVDSSERPISYSGGLASGRESRIVKTRRGIYKWWKVKLPGGRNAWVSHKQFHEMNHSHWGKNKVQD